MTRHELKMLFNLFVKHNWNRDWEFSPPMYRSAWPAKRYSSAIVDCQLKAYTKWAPTEIRRIISNLSSESDTSQKYDALYEFEIYISQIGDGIEIFNQTHSITEVNPFEVLMDISQSFLDYAYDYCESIKGG